MKRFISLVVLIPIFYGCFVFAIAGFGEKKYEYKNNFSYYKFFLGTPECSGTLSKISYLTSIKHIFS